MYNNLIGTLPVQLACQLICAGNYSIDISNITVDVPMPRQATVIPDGYTSFPDIGVAYKYFNYKRPWNDARKTCIEDGGNLAIIDTFKKIEYIMGVKDDDAAPHVGLHRFFKSDEWISVKTGLPVTVLSWAPVTNIDEYDWHCLAMWSDGRGVNVNRCTDLRNFICEISLSVN